MKKRGLLVLGIAIAAVNMGGCASIAKEVVKQVISKDDTGNEKGEKEKDSGEKDSSQEVSDSDGGQSSGVQETAAAENISGSYEQLIKNELEPRLGTAKNSQFTYGFERVDYEGSNGFYASPMEASLENGIVSTYRRDLNKDGRDELLVVYVEGSRQSSDGRNHFCLGVYGDTGSGIGELGKISFDNCFSGVNGEEYLFGLKDLGDKRLIYSGGRGDVWTWADGVSPEIHLHQMENNSIREIYQVDAVGSDENWLTGWRSALQSYGFDLEDIRWDECNLAGESGFEVLAVGRCTTEDRGSGRSGNEDYQQYWLDHGVITGGVYGPDSQVVMQMNQTMRPYSGGGQSAYAAGNGYAGGGSSYNTGDYILPNSSSMYLTRADLAGLTMEQLRLARNEIYARHGRKFKTKELQDYFNSKSWYVGTIDSDSFKDSYLNIYEKENIKLIQSMEK